MSTPQTWACITTDGMVGNCIVATPEFVAEYLPQSGFDKILSIETVTPRPSPGWTYNGTVYIAPGVIPEVPVDPGPALFFASSMKDLGYDSPSYNSAP